MDKKPHRGKSPNRSYGKPSGESRAQFAGRREQAPQRGQSPKWDKAPRQEQGDRWEKGPRREGAPHGHKPFNRDQASRRDEGPRQDRPPRQEQGNRWDKGPRCESAPRGHKPFNRDQAPKYNDRDQGAKQDKGQKWDKHSTQDRPSRWERTFKSGSFRSTEAPDKRGGKPNEQSRFQGKSDRGQGKGGKPGNPRHTHWGDVAQWYDQLVGKEGSEFHQQVIIPGVMRMLGLNKSYGGMKILDLACGQGVLSRKLATAGCEVTGVDAAEQLIEVARQRNEQDEQDINYIVADVTELVDEDGQLMAELEPASYDAVTIILSIQNITPLSPVWKACYEALKPDGHLIVVMMHPCFRVPKKSDWHWDYETQTQLRLIAQYLTSDEIEIKTHPGLAAHGKDQSVTYHFHRPLQAYINTLGNAGLLIDNIAEWTSHKSDQAGPKKEAMDRARQEIPMFLALRARKVERAE